VIRLGCQNLAVAKIIFIGHFYVAFSFFPFSSSLWMAAGLLGLRCGNNTAMEPYRAFIADTETRSTAYRFSSSKFLHWFWANFGKCFTIPFPLVLLVQLGNCQLGFCLVFLGAVCSIGSVWWSSYTKEIRLLKKKLKKIKERAIGTFYTIY
jgi:maltose/moltooligosaccharide transporter